MSKNHRFLSWVLCSNMPGYGGFSSYCATFNKRISNGDSANTLDITISSHSGTHVDAPAHFHSDGRTIDNYLPHELIFQRIAFIDLPMSEGRLIEEVDFSEKSPIENADFLLIKTGFCEYRNQQKYVYDNPGFDAKAAREVLNVFPNIKGIGIDSISINRWSQREKGREAHRILLDQNRLLIVEDMDLRCVKLNYIPQEIVISPLRISGGDGAPATVWGLFSNAQ